jgi:SMP-30/Gluconolactonase/LRE-like region
MFLPAGFRRYDILSVSGVFNNYKEEFMKKLLAGLISLLLIVGGMGIARAVVDSGAVQTFVTLPDGVRFPEGIAANPANGDIYVATFDFGPNANKLLRYNRQGQLLAQRDFGRAPLLGLIFEPVQRKVYIANAGDLTGAGAAKVQRISADFESTTRIEDVAILPGIGAPTQRTEGNPDGSFDTIIFGSNSAPAPNAFEFDKLGNLYVSDSFQGAIFRIDDVIRCKHTCAVTTLVHDPLLATAGFPPFGANGLAFNGDNSVLFIANTGDDRILKLDMATKVISVFAESINGADGIVFDRQGRLWVAANQNDEVVALNANGRPVIRLGKFEGIGPDGAPKGLLFPASPVIVGDDMFVTNLALPLTPAVGDEPEEDVTRWTVSRINLRGL